MRIAKIRCNYQTLGEQYSAALELRSTLVLVAPPTDLSISWFFIAKVALMWVAPAGDLMYLQFALFVDLF